MLALKVLCFVLCFLAFINNGTSWRRRRRRRRCDSTPCQWTWGGCSLTCGNGSQSPRVTRRQGSCGACNLPGARRCNTQCCPVSCVWGSWGIWGKCSTTCGSGTRTRSRGYSRGASCGGSGCSGPSTSSQKCNTECCPVNCVWGAWGNYGSCSANCDGGTQSRSRSKTRSHSCGGSCSGSSASSRPCNTHHCPINCLWSSWGKFGSCSAGCGGGKQTRSRSIATNAQHGGVACSGSVSSSRDCNTQPCPIDCLWSDWGGFDSCSLPCGVGTQRRSRSVTVEAQHGGTTCSGSASSSRSCNTQPCPIDCSWSAWSGYESCSLPCGGGTQRRSRSVTVKAQHGGAECSGSSTNSRICNSQPCPINCRWNSWGEYGGCSLTCGSGTQARTRSVAVQSQHGGTPCSGSTTSSRTCNSHPCPIDCELGNWSKFGFCSAVCGIGGQTRTREVTVIAQHGGIACTGSKTDTRSCNTHPCPIHCTWGPWSEFGGCSVSCGGGNERKTRSVLVNALHGGIPCPGSSSFIQSCNTQPCPVDCLWGEWSDYSQCSVSCGGGTQTKSRNIFRNLMHGGSNCTGPNDQTQTCNTQCCPVDCQWGQWSKFNDCPVNCGSGTQFRNRQVLVAADCGGQACMGEDTSSQFCNTHCCPVDCQWGKWSYFGECSVQCGGGEKHRHRQVSMELACGGKTCNGSDIDSTPCNTHSCPVDCVWGNWGVWGNCNVTCGGGTKKRSRKFDVIAQHGGVECIGLMAEKEPCNDNCCPVDCVWENWSDWSSCSKTCERGSQSRFRSNSVFEFCGGSPCNGSFTEERTCNDVCCPADCVWGQWSAWGDCSKSCETGLKVRTRDITSNKTCNGADCIGEHREKQQCNTQCCPVDCAVSVWNTWSACPQTCGVANIKVRNRSVITNDTCGGKECPTLLEIEGCEVVCYNGATATATGCLCEPGWSGLCCDQDVDECTQQGNSSCPLKSVCVNTEGSYRCDCDPGYQKNGDMGCENVDECTSLISNCHQNGRCVDTEGSFLCVCKTGYSGNGTVCSEINECEVGTVTCPDNTACVNTQGSYSCPCLPGFIFKDGQCSDVNECQQENAECDTNAICENNVGSYKCFCNEGLSGDGKTCVGIDECVEFGDEACLPNALCTDLPVGFQCDCMAGFTGNGFLECSDINECSDPQKKPCTGDYMECHNTVGSFECTCPSYMGLQDGNCVELPPSFALRIGEEKKESSMLGGIKVQKLALYVLSGSAAVLLLVLLALRVYKRRTNAISNDGVSNPSYEGGEGTNKASDNAGFVADEIDDKDL